MTDQATWNRVDEYLDSKLLGTDAALDAASAGSAAAGLPPIAVSPTQGRFLELIARSIKARNVLEIGTLGGYSTICLARVSERAAGLSRSSSTLGTHKSPGPLSPPPVCRPSSTSGSDARWTCHRS